MTEVALAAAGLVAVVALWWVAAHNRFVQQRQHIVESWRDVDVELKRRHDLVPALVRVVEAYAAHERSLLAGLAQGRADVAGHVVALAEAYPQLGSSASFLSLQRELAETEDRLAAARRTHASNVERYNSRVDTLPTRLVARVGGFERSSYVEIAAS